MKKGDKTHTLVAQAHLIDEFGRTGAQFINQIHYWLQKKNVGITHDEKKWVYNTTGEWAKQLLVSTRTIERYISCFLKLGIIKVEKLSSHKSNRTNFLTLNYDCLESLKPHKKQSTVSKKPLISTVSNDKMSESNRQNVGMVKQENTYKDINSKSDKIVSNSLTSKQAEQVIVKKIRGNGVGDNGNVSVSENNNISKPPALNIIKKTTVQDMLSLWNQTFSSSSTRMSKDLAPLLLSAFKQKCDGNMKRWENYLHRLQSSDYITSEAFNLSLNWALKFKTMDRIFKGELGAKDIPVELDKKTEERRALDHIQSSMMTEPTLCGDIRSLILQKLGANTYNAWFTKVKFVDVSGEIKMKADNKFVEDYVLQHFSHLFSV